MISDARSLAPDSIIRADLCLVGAGAVGITIARELADSGLRVCLLESGGLEPDADIQALNQGTSVGFPYYDLDVARLRYFGGTTNHWSGACRPLDPIDFEPRAWVPYSGWPFGKDHLDPWYARAQTLCQLGAYEYEPDYWERPGALRFSFPGDRVVTAMYQISPPTRFGEVYRKDIETAEGIECLLHANVLGLEADPSGRTISRARVASSPGRDFQVQARHFILAAGAIENARVLLASHPESPQGGLGNEHDLVGRFFMEHLSVTGGFLLPSDPSLSRGIYDHRTLEGITVRAFLALSREALQQEGLLNARAFLGWETDQNALAAASVGVQGADAMMDAALHRRRPGSLGQSVRDVIREFDAVTIHTYQRLFRANAPGRAFSLVNHIEQAPDPTSRVMLSTDRDAFGTPKVLLDWRFGELERRTLRRTNEIIAQEVGRARLGRVRLIPDEEPARFPPGVRGAWHQMGTTRMHPDPRQGVVDANGKVHGLENLFVAGGSVFPTSGYTNPTLTIVALALRLADHMKELAP
ncbi:MAG: GMC family oxidoreductase [Gemmatimonadales bacterium]|nr:MAG: GMC family oxidoreductase [Gemmatimonadales bacterium]